MLIIRVVVPFNVIPVVQELAGGEEHLRELCIDQISYDHEISLVVEVVDPVVA